MDLSKKAGEIWKGMSKEKKKEWECKAEDARGKYEKAMKENGGGQGEYFKREKSKRSKGKDRKKSQHLLDTCHPSCCQGS